MKNHPHILSLQRLYESEVQSFRKVHRMIDLFESIIKSHTVVIMSEYVKHNQLSNLNKNDNFYNCPLFNLFRKMTYSYLKILF